MCFPRTESVNFTPLSLVFFHPYSNEERIKISNLMLQKDPNLSNYPPNKILCRSAFHFDNFEMFKYYLQNDLIDEQETLENILFNAYDDDYVEVLIILIVVKKKMINFLKLLIQARQLSKTIQNT